MASTTTSASARARLPGMLAEIRGALVAAYRQLGQALPEALLEFASVEAEFQAALLGRVLGTSVNALPLARSSSSSPRRSAGALRDALARQSADIGRALQVSASAGGLRGEGIAGAVRRFRVAADLVKSSADALVRTSLLHASNAAAVASYDASSVVEDVHWLSTLDARTCLICGPRDGHALSAIPGGHHPPVHPRCRCTVCPVLDLPGVSTGTPTRASEDGPVQVKDYATWFKRQSAGFQSDVLGPQRYTLFTRGRLPLAAFAPGDNILSLAELKIRHARLFEDVGLAS